MLSIIDDVAAFTLYCCILVIDGAAINNPIEGEVSEFALYLQTYQDNNMLEKNICSKRIKINSMEYPHRLFEVFKDKYKNRQGKNVSE